LTSNSLAEENGALGLRAEAKDLLGVELIDEPQSLFVTEQAQTDLEST
jgi:hypothetical protein